MLKEKKIRKIRKIITGNELRPRLAVFRSNKRLFAQIINDQNHTTIASASGANALEVGSEIAEKAKSLKINRLVFDRRTYKYHGKIKKVADAARENGIKI